MWALGCLTDAPGVTPCPVGSSGCPCTDGGACDGMLECHPEAKECYDPSCTPGTENCPCHMDMCFGSLACEQGICHVPSSSDTSGVADDSASSSSGGGQSLETTVASSADSTTEPASTGATSQGTTGVDEGPCHTCFVTTAINDCMDTFNTCTGGGMCNTTYSCVTEGTPFADCCIDIGDGLENWNALAACVDAMGCAESCDGVITSCG